jgi:enoyl-CoA hydratase
MPHLILCDESDAIVTLTLNNPDKRNALCRAAWVDLANAIDALQLRDDIRCIIIRGAGEDAFAAGADISEFPDNRSNAKQARAYGDDVERALNALLSCKHPTIAMIYGACTGGGLEIACCCDMRIAGASARFGVPINRIGHAFAAAEMKPVLQLVGKAAVLELLLEGRILDAEEALAKGMINRIVADENVVDDVLRTARRIARGAPLAARMTKRLVQRMLNGDKLSDSEIDEVYALCDSDDYAEGIRAFLAKENPTFTGQ